VLEHRPGTVAQVEFTRQHVVEGLRRAGLLADAEWAELSLPESFDVDDMLNVFAKRGLTKDRLIDLLGGSP
jgi:hypothetical protein